MTQKTCPECGKKFKSDQRAKKFCGEKCRKVRRLAYEREYNRAHPRPSKGGRRGYLRIPTPQVCHVCGHSFQAQKTNEKFCSEPCRSEAKRITAREWMRNHYVGRKK